jgi:hypothetical protein
MQGRTPRRQRPAVKMNFVFPIREQALRKPGEVLFEQYLESQSLLFEFEKKKNNTAIKKSVLYNYHLKSRGLWHPDYRPLLSENRRDDTSGKLNRRSA